MKRYKFILSFIILLASVVLCASAANAQQVSDDDELLAALKDSTVTKIEIAYKDPSISQNVVLKRGVAIDGGGNTLSFENGAYIRSSENTTLSLSNITTDSVGDYAFKAGGSVNLNGRIIFTDGYGILLEKGASMSAGGADVKAEKGCSVAFGVDCGGGTVQISALGVSSTNGNGTMIYVYRNSGNLVFSGKNVIDCTFGKGIFCQTGGKSSQTIKLSSGAQLTVNAVNGKVNSTLCAAIDVRECSFTMEKDAGLIASGGNSALSCAAFSSAEGCTLNVSSSISGGNISQGYHAGAITVLGTGKTEFGDMNSISISGKNGLLASKSSAVTIGKSSNFTANVDSGDGLCVYKGKLTFKDGCSVKIKASGRCIYSKGDFACGTYCESILEPTGKKNQGGIYTEGGFDAGDYSVFKIKGADAKKCAIYVPGSVLFGNYCTLEAEGCATGICTSCGIEAGHDCVFSITGADYCGIYSLGTLTTDRVNFGKNSSINIEAESSAVYTCEALCLEDGCKAKFSAGDSEPAIWISTSTTQQGYIRFTGSEVTVKSRLSASKNGETAVRCVGSFIVENNSKVDIINNSAFGVICTAGDLVVGVGSRMRVYGGCAVLVDDGNIRVIQGGTLETHGYLDSGIRVQNGMLRVAENSTLVTQGERYGAEMLDNGSVWLESPKYFDIRSTKTYALYIEDGVFSVSALKALSCWYPQDGKSNTETWWNADTSKMYAWETMENVGEGSLAYADYTKNDVTGKLTFAGAKQIASDGLESEISSCSSYVNRISMYKTRPIAVPNYMFIPAGRSFSWQLSSVTTDGTRGKFALSGTSGDGTASVSEDGIMTYVASDDTRGEQVFEFTVTGSDGTVSLPAKLTINVTRSKPPAAYNDSFAVKVNGSLSAKVNATDFDGTIARIEIVEKPEHGMVTIGTDGAFKYTPEQSYEGVDMFKFIAVDNDGDESTPATATLFIGMDNMLCALNKTYIAAKNEPTEGKFGYNVPKGGSVEFITVTELPEYGSIVCSGSDFVYTPPVDYAGTQQIIFTVTDSTGTVSNEGFVSIITVPSQKPVAHAMKIDCVSGKEYSGKLSADDLDGIVKSFLVEKSPEHGELILNKDSGTFTYNAPSDFTGTDSFLFCVYDDEGLESETVEVMISVDTLMKHLETSGQLGKIVIFSILGGVALIVVIILVVIANERRKKKIDMEYEEELSHAAEDDYNDFGF